MRAHLYRTVAAAAGLAAAVSVGLSACSSDSGDGGESPTDHPADTQTDSTGSGVSSNGVTTSVEAPADSTEQEYFRACQEASTWMDDQGGDRQAQVEVYLEMVQSSDSAGPGTFDTPWSELEPPRQSAVIVAVQAAADELCG